MASRKDFSNRIEKRQTEAKTRQEASNKLTFDQKLARAKIGSREHSKLLLKQNKK